ncbi:GTP pyrophosphokinase [Clostridium sp.]|uniref:GTP pyrophosphokinase n=1 Tax=Clostridium sp. TaxID=1506 RepID=UPI003F38FFB6
MSIKEFEYLDKAINVLEETYEELSIVSTIIEEKFYNVLDESKVEFLNISSRVKSAESLREKIVRNKYYKKFPNAESLVYNLSDLIGVRIECRFGDDEKNIYRYLKKYFNKCCEENYYYNEDDENFHIKLEGKQPQRQKNGFTIYRIDGRYIYNGKIIPFELQIKSLVNMFWGEIEHQIIYKNSNYIIENNFLKDIMGSIKNNLSMIDKQLITVFNHFESKKRTDTNSRKKHLEDIVSKIIYDLFSNKMKESIGMSVDFKNSCETIIRYTFEIDDTSSEEEYTETLIKALKRLGELSSENIDFNSKIIFERDIKYKDKFTKIIGEYFEKVINNEFNWNLFFRILFALEPLDNVGDFEKFMEFLKCSYIESKYINKQKSILKERFGSDFVEIENKIAIKTAETLIEIDRVEIVYDFIIYEINDEVENIYKYILNNISTISDWKEKENHILEEFDKYIKLAVLG